MGSCNAGDVYDPKNGQRVCRRQDSDVRDTATGGFVHFAAGAALLNYYPHAECGGSPNSIYNYQTITTAGKNNANINARFNRTFGSAGSGPAQHRADCEAAARRTGGTLRCCGRASMWALTTRTQRATCAIFFCRWAERRETNGYSLTAGYIVGLWSPVEQCDGELEPQPLR